MYTRYLVFLIIIISGCTQQESLEKKIYDEYIDSYYEAFKKTKTDIGRIDELDWLLPDTVIIEEDYFLYNSYNDSLVADESRINIKKDDQFIIKSVKGGTFELASVNDSSKRGVILNKELARITGNNYYLNRKIDFYDRLLKNREIYIDSVRIKNNLSEDEFFKLLAKENHKRYNEVMFAIE